MPTRYESHEMDGYNDGFAGYKQSFELTIWLFDRQFLRQFDRQNGQITGRSIHKFLLFQTAGISNLNFHCRIGWNASKWVQMTSKKIEIWHSVNQKFQFDSKQNPEAEFLSSSGVHSGDYVATNELDQRWFQGPEALMNG